MSADVASPVKKSDIGRLIGIARRDARLAPMETIDEGRITIERGLEGDHKGLKFKNRAITILSLAAWRDALGELADASGAPDLPWTVRRANLLVDGLDLPKARGGLVRIGDVLLEVTYPTQPCKRMEDAHAGLLKALHPDWRGGVTTRVLSGGDVRVGDEVAIELRPPEKVRKLP